MSMVLRKIENTIREKRKTDEVRDKRGERENEK